MLLIRRTIHGFDLSLYYKNGLWLNYIGLSLEGFVGGFSSFREDIRLFSRIEADLEDFSKVLAISYLGVAIESIFFFLSVITLGSIPILTKNAFLTTGNVIITIIFLCIFIIFSFIIDTFVIVPLLFLYLMVLKIMIWARTP